MKLPESSDSLIPSSSVSPDVGSEETTISHEEAPGQESPKGFQLPNNASSILPISNASLPSGVAGFIDELAAAAGSIAGGVTQLIETATGVIQNATISTNLTKTSEPKADNSSDSKPDNPSKESEENTSDIMESTSISPNLPNQDAKNQESTSSAVEGEGPTVEVPTTPPQPIEGPTTEQTENPDNKENNPANPTAVPDEQKEGLSQN